MTAAPVVVVANPTAGRGKAGRLIGKADAILHALRVEHEVRVSESGDDLEATVRRAAEDGAGIVAVLGGDGTVSLGANGVLGTGAALAVLPAGTGDDFAKVIGAGRFDAAVRLLANPKIVPIDVVSLVAGVEHRHFVNIAGAGFDSEVNETANGMSRAARRHGHLRRRRPEDPLAVLARTLRADDRRGGPLGGRDAHGGGERHPVRGRDEGPARTRA